MFFNKHPALDLPVYDLKGQSKASLYILQFDEFIKEDTDLFNELDPEFPLELDNEIITATVMEVLKNGIKVSVGNDKNLVLTIKKNQLAKEIEDCRPEIFTKGNKVDCMIVDMDKEKRKASLSIKEL